MAKILIIDDRPVNRQFLTTLLGYQKHELREASDGAEGLRIACEMRPDLIISDVLMPTMDGYEFVRRLREERAIGKTPIIFSTAHYLSRESQALAKKCGITQIIYKPCEPQVVLDAVANALTGTVEVGAVTVAVEDFDREHQQLLTNKLAEKTEQLRDAHGKLTALMELSTDLGNERDPVELLDRYCSVARDVIGAGWTMVVFLDGNRREVQHLGVIGLELEDSAQLRSALLVTGIFKTVVSDGRTICLSDVTSTPAELQLPRPLPRAASLLVAPLAMRGQIYGWICLADKLGFDAFSEQDEQLAQALAAKMAVAYDNARLYSESLKYASKLENEISERAKVERQLSESRTRLAGIIDSAMDAIITVDSDHRVLLFNDAAEKMFRCTAAEAIGHPLDRFIPARFRPNHSKDIRKFGETGVTTRAMAATRAVSGVRTDGEEFPLEASISQIEVGGQKLYTVIMRDITERKQAEATVQESEAKLRQVIDGLGPYMFVGLMTPDGVMIEANQPVLAAAGLKPEDVIGKPFEETYWWAYSEPVQEQLRAAIARAVAGEASRYDVQIRVAEDELIWIDFSLHPVQDLSGKLIYLVPSANVIDERKLAEEALQKSEEQFRTMANSIPQLAWMAHADGFIFWYNQRWHDYTGTTPEEMEGWGWQSVHDPKVLPQVMERWQHAIATGQPFDMEFPLRGADGSFRTFLTRVQPVKDSQDRVVRWFGTNTDVNEMKRLEASLRQSEASLKESQHTAHLGSFEFDVITGTWKSSEVLDELFGIDQGYDRKMGGWLALVHPDDRRMMDDYVTGDEDKWNQTFDMEYRIIRPTDQVERWMWTRASVDRDTVGRAFRIRGTTQDITERKLAEETLRSKNQELAAMTQQLWQASKLATMGELSASIAHELNNPLATVSLRTENLLLQLPPESDQRTPLEVIAQEVDRMANLVNNLLQFSRRSHRQISTVDTREEIENSIELVHYHLRNRKIEVVREFADSLPTIQADRQQLRQLFLNLLTNASDAMPQGGKLIVRATSDGSPGAGVTIEFADSGEGITAENLEKIWEPFFTTKPEGKGTGLGLAICRRIVEEHGGTIRIESLNGDGTTVRMIFPATESGSRQVL